MYGNQLDMGDMNVPSSGATVRAVATLVNELVSDNLLTASNTVNIFRYVPPSEWVAIQNKTSTYDCHSAIMAAINSISVVASTYYRSLASVVFPLGLYNCSQTLQPKGTCALIGLNSGMDGNNQVQIKFPVGVAGIIINRYNTISGGIEEPETYGADGSRFVGIHFLGGGNGAGVCHGAHLRARAAFTDCTVSNFNGNGFHIVASSTVLDADVTGNSNLFRIVGCSSQNNWGHGLFADGADVNAGYVLGFNAVGNGLSAVYDSSFLGNTYEACHAATNGLRGQVYHLGNRWYLNDETSTLGGSTEPGTNSDVWALRGAGVVHFTYPQWVSGNAYSFCPVYWSDNPNASNIFIGCYAEGGGSPVLVKSPSMVIGGAFGDGFNLKSSGFRLTNNGVTNRFKFESPSGSGSVYAMNLNVQANTPITLEATGDSANGLSPFTWDINIGSWVSRHSGLGSRTPIHYTTALSTATCGRSAAIGAGQVIFPQGVWVGSSVANARKIDTGTAPPTTGEAARGDVRYNTNAAVGSPSGWQCVTGGTNGSTAVWAAMPGLVSL